MATGTMSDTSLGEFLRSKREILGYSLDHMVEETNISHRFLEGLESDDYHAFPAEAFITGFIRSYADYLELDPQEALRLYEKNVRREPLPVPEAQETRHGKSKEPADQRSMAGAPESSPFSPRDTDPRPVTGNNRPDALNPAERFSTTPPSREESRQTETGETKSSRREPVANAPVKVNARVLIIGMTALILSIAAGISILLSGNSGNSDKDKAAAGPSEYRIEETAFEKRLYPGDSLLVTLRGDTYKILLKDINNTVDFETPQGSVSILLGEETLLDFDKDMQSDLKLAVTDFSRKNPASGVLLRFEKIATVAAATDASGIPVDMSATDVQNVDMKERKSGILFRAARGPYPFVVTVNFRTGSLFRHEADRREWKEQYYAKGETITINAESSLIVWSANAQAAKVTVTASGGKTADLELGGPGEIAVKRIGWTQAEGTWVMSAVDQD